MSVKILGGELKGLPLFIPNTDKTRPTSVMLKRRVFDSRQYFDSYWFIDLCAGSGAIGLEAISRGAQGLDAIEISTLAYKTLLQNVKTVKSKLSDSPQINTYKMKIEKWLELFKERYKSFSNEQKEQIIIFFDPPYEQHSLYENICAQLLVEDSWFRGELWVESDSHKGPKDSFWKTYEALCQKKFQQGTRIIYIFSRI